AVEPRAAGEGREPGRRRAPERVPDLDECPHVVADERARRARVGVGARQSDLSGRRVLGEERHPRARADPYRIPADIDRLDAVAGETVEGAERAAKPPVGPEPGD